MSATPPPSLPADEANAAALLRTLLDVSLTGVILFRPVYEAAGTTIIDLGYEHLNPAAQHMLQLPERPAESFLTLYPSAVGPEGVFAFYRATFLSGEVGRHQFNYQYDGLDGYFYLVAQRQGPVLVVSFTDTNDQPRTVVEEALRQSQAREQAAHAEAERRRAELQQLLTQAHAAIAVFSGPQHVIDLVNDSHLALWGRTREQVLGRPLFEAIPEAVGIGYEELLASVLTTGEPYLANELSARLVRHGVLEEVFFNFVYQPLRNAQGQISGVVVVATEITEQVRARQLVQQLAQELEVRVQERTQELAAANAELQDSNARLLRTNADLDNFIYTASHDLKAPISNIEGLLRLLEDLLPAELRTEDELQPVLAQMQQAVERFTRTIGHLTDVSKLQLEFAQAATPTDLLAVLGDVRQDLAPLIAETDGQLKVEVVDCSSLLISEKNLRSVLYNLVSNAFKYRHPDRPPLVRLSCRLEAGQCILRVQDNGLGLSQAQQSKLFGLFQRLHTHVEGTGVGLYMVKKIVENAGGTLTVESQPDVGSTFVVALPAAAV